MDEEFVTFIKPFEQKGNEFESDDPLNSFRKTLLELEIPKVLIVDGNIILTAGQGKVPSCSLTNDQYCKELAQPICSH